MEKQLRRLERTVTLGIFMISALVSTLLNQVTGLVGWMYVAVTFMGLIILYLGFDVAEDIKKKKEKPCEH